MRLKQPVFITSRLLPGIKIGNATIQIEYSGFDNGRIVYRHIIDLMEDGKETTFEGTDLKSGRGGGNLNNGFSSLLSFLGAFTEGETGLFPQGLREWAEQNADEITMMGMEFEETILIEE